MLSFFYEQFISIPEKILNIIELLTECLRIIRTHPPINNYLINQLLSLPEHQKFIGIN